MIWVVVMHFLIKKNNYLFQLKKQKWTNLKHLLDLQDFNIIVTI